MSDPSDTPPSGAPTPSFVEPSLESSLESSLDNAIPSDGSLSAMLLVLDGRQRGRVFTLDGKEGLIGRAKTADVRIDEPAVSQKHAKLVFTGRHHQLTELGSTNGTYVNENRLVGTVELHGGELIRIGETVLTYLVKRDGDEDLPTMALSVVHQHRGRLAPISFSAPAAYRSLPPARGDVIQVRPEEEGPTLRDMITKLISAYAFFRRHWVPIAAFIFVGGIIGGVTAFVLPPASTATFDVKLTPSANQNPVQPAIEQNNLEFFQSAETNFRSPDLVRATLSAVGEKPITDQKVKDVQDRLKFESTGYRTYRGSYSERTPERAVKFLKEHVRLYLNTEIEKTLKVIRAQVDFLKGQLDDNEHELSKTESELKDFKEQHIGGLPDQAQSQFTAKVDLQTRQRDLSTELERKRMELEVAKTRLKSENALLERKVAASRPYEDALVEVNRKLSEARARGLGEDHPEVKQLTREAAQLKQLSEQTINTQTSDVERRSNPAYQALRDEVAALEVAAAATQRELGRVTKQLSDVEGVVKMLPEVEARHAELTRSYDSTKALHSKLYEQYKASQLQFELERASAAARYEIITPPTAYPPSLKKTLAVRVFVSAFVGAFVGICIALFRELKRYLRETSAAVS